MFFSHEGLEIGGGEVLWSALMPAPFHEQAVGNAPVDAQDQHAFVALDAAAIIVVGNIQPLVQAALDPPALTVEAQPGLGPELFGRGAGDQGDFFVLAALGPAQQPGGLHRKGKPDVFGCQGGGADDPVFLTPLVFLPGAGLRGCGTIRGENPLGERRPSFGYWPAAWAGSFCR